MAQRVPPIIAAKLAGWARTGDLATDVDALEALHDREITREHLHRVAPLAGELARRFGLDSRQAETAAWLHDIGGVFAYPEMVAACETLGLTVLPEEARAPMLLHQKLSALIAHDVFGVEDAVILDAIRCHTTLRAGPTPLDELLFVADKLEWDRPGEPPYKGRLLAALDVSLEAGARLVVADLWADRAELFAVHPWLREAHGWFEG